MLPYGRQLIEEDDIAAVVAQLRDPWLTQGPAVGQFEEALTHLTGARYAVAVSSGTAALHLACLAAGVRSGDTGITSTITFVASANSIRYAGGAPSLVDVTVEDALVSVAALTTEAERLKGAGRPPKVIVPVDFAGSVANLPVIRTLADRIGAMVIEDAAHSLGAEYHDAGVACRAGSGAHAQFGILSFHPVKHITTGEGGAILTNDEGAYRELCDLRTHGITREPARLTKNDGPWYHEQHSLGFNYRITDLQCALGLSQARKADRFIARRRQLAARYDRALRSAPFETAIAPLLIPSGVRSSYHLYVIRLLGRASESLDAIRARRKALYMHLRERRIAPQVHYIPVHTQPDFVRSGYGGQHLPGADAYYASCLSLPLFPAMEDADVDRVVNAIGDFLLSSSP